MPLIGSPVPWLNDVINDKLEVFKRGKFRKSHDEDNIPSLPESQLEDDVDDTDPQWIYVKHCLEYLVALNDLLCQAGFTVSKSGRY